MIKRLFQLVDRFLAQFEDWTLFTIVALAFFSALANVFLRKFTHVSLYWSDEVVRKAIFISTYLGASAAIRHRSLIRIDALPQLLPFLQKPLTFFSHLAVLVFATILFILGWQMMLEVYHDPYARTATLRLPEWLFYGILPLTGLMMFLRTLLIMAEDWSQSRRS